MAAEDISKALKKYSHYLSLLPRHYVSIGLCVKILKSGRELVGTTPQEVEVYSRTNRPNKGRTIRQDNLELVGRRREKTVKESKKERPCDAMLLPDAKRSLLRVAKRKISSPLTSTVSLKKNLRRATTTPRGTANTTDDEGIDGQLLESIVRERHYL